ncbi:preprotein translocase subunit SecE [Mycetocola spongiae]|uniref:preprotein translocase subunit SecE n=1 Tax=Mycetocola spongiae TaxID=2859226 RepID=UPI001CF1859B|nr:preprotein translocase subunit SecE [Mycetocola spongiae]UCR88375.1 preprotein translocase subunit SecE [Mycetocola spongiae]
MAANVIDEPGEEIVAASKQARSEKRGPFAGIILFLKQVVAELKKVVTPTRKELINFTLVVLVFVLIMMGLVYGVDRLFAWLVVLVFGAPV